MVTAPSVQFEKPAPSSDALTQCAAIIAHEPALAVRLAAERSADEFARALADVAQSRGIALDDAALNTLTNHREIRLGHHCSDWPLSSRRFWQPFALEWTSDGAELIWGCATATPDSPFHEQTVMDLRTRPINRLFAVRTPLTAKFAAALQADALPTRGLIFHMSRCGSTLIAQALKAWPGTRVISEPALLDAALTMACTGNDAGGQLFRIVLAALSQPRGDDRDVIIKLDAWHAMALTKIKTLVDAPWLFVYRDPCEVLVSHAREPGRHTIPGMLPETWFNVARSHEAGALTDYAAHVIGTICSAIVPHADAANLINYSELPDAIAARVAPLFGLATDARSAELKAMLSRHAKRSYENFVDDRPTKRAATSATIRDAAQRWIEPHYAALEKIRCGQET